MTGVQTCLFRSTFEHIDELDFSDNEGMAELGEAVVNAIEDGLENYNSTEQEYQNEDERKAAEEMVETLKEENFHFV